MTLKQRTELWALRETLGALDRIEILVKPRLSVPAAEAVMDDYADHLSALRQKTEATIRILEEAA